MKTMVFASAAICSLAWLSCNSFSAEETKNDARSAPVKVEEVDPYKVPEGPTPSAKLVDFCKFAIMQGRKVHSKAEYDEFATKMHPAVQRASEIILSQETNENSEYARFARRSLFGLSILPISTASETDTDKFITELIAFLCKKDVEPTRDDVGLLLGTGRMLERKDPAQAKRLYESVIPTYKKSKMPNMDRFILVLEGAIKRMNLMGKELALKGTTMDGKPFELSSLKGKLVLVDFWATWCRICIEEFPNVKKNYADYHKKGFEIVGVSVDQETPKLTEFLAANPLPWIVTHEEGGHNDAIERCGVTAYPTTLMVGKDGKVISVAVRGEELNNLLKRELGDPDPEVEESALKANEPKK